MGSRDRERSRWRYYQKGGGKEEGTERGGHFGDVKGVQCKGALDLYIYIYLKRLEVEAKAYKHPKKQKLNILSTHKDN